MSEAFSVPSSFEGIARLFPLPNVVLFPQVMLPLHIFEPRYRQMTAEALAGDRLIALVLLKPGWEAASDKRPALHAVACLGKIVADQQLEDGRYNILLRGLSRARLQSEVENDKLYRSARVHLLQDDPVAISSWEIRFRDQLCQLLPAWLATLGLAAEQQAKLFQSGLPLGAVCDILGFALPLAVEFKQELLEQVSVERRIRRLLQFLETHQPPQAAADSPNKFPPEFSSN